MRVADSMKHGKMLKLQKISSNSGLSGVETILNHIARKTLEIAQLAVLSITAEIAVITKSSTSLMMAAKRCIMSNKRIDKCLVLPSKRKTVHIPQRLHDTLKQLAKQNGQTIEFIIRKAVQEYLQRMAQKNG